MSRKILVFIFSFVLWFLSFSQTLYIYKINGEEVDFSLKEVDKIFFNKSILNLKSKNNIYKISLDSVKYLSFKKINLSINKIDLNNVKFYPNPVENNLIISFLSFSNEDGVIEIFDLQGKKVVDRNIKVTLGLNEVSIDTGFLRTGNYILIIRTPQVKLNLNFIKQ